MKEIRIGRRTQLAMLLALLGLVVAAARPMLPELERYRRIRAM